VAAPVLRHRIILEYGARLDGKTPASVVSELLKEVPPHSRELPRTVAGAA
jgi:MoxR-like ATPase